MFFPSLSTTLLETRKWQLEAQGAQMKASSTPSLKTWGDDRRLRCPFVRGEAILLYYEPSHIKLCCPPFTLLPQHLEV